MADRDFYTHQHAQKAGEGSTVVRVGQLEGRALADSHGREGGLRDGISVAVGNVFEPYVKPKRRRKDNPDKLLCMEDGCNAFPMKELDYCTGHARSMGLIENWKKAGREAE